MPSPYSIMEKRHIVVADDEVLLCKTIGDILRREGYKITLVHDGSQALSLVQREQVDLVLLDLMMPGMNGLQVLERIKQDSPSTRVIMLSGFGSPEYIRQAEKAGADGFIDKPLGIEMLKKRIRDAFAEEPHNPFHQPAVE